MRSRRSQAGFTLIELFVATAILGLARAVDDGPPLLRLRVTAPGGRVVFDTDPGAPLDEPATVPLDRGRAAIGN